MNYNAKRRKAKLEEWYIMQKIGITHKEWKDIVTGKRNLANNKLDNFIKLTDPKAKEYINQNNEKRKINEWFDNTNQQDFRNLMAEYKVKLMDISNITGWDKTTISTTMSRKILSENCKCSLYYFFNDENNRRNQWVINRAKTFKPTIKDKEKLNEGVTPSISVPLDTNVLAKAFDLKPIPSSISFGICEKVENEPKTTASFVKKEDYDKILSEKEQLEKELNRYRYLIDQLISNLTIK